MVDKFLSTPSARRATVEATLDGLTQYDFYPRPPRGGRLAFSCFSVVSRGFLSTPSARRATAAAATDGFAEEISIHALREEGDECIIYSGTKQVEFLSTPSARRATKRKTHVPVGTQHFYPRPPRGGRLSGMTILTSRGLFLSTPSARRATAKTETKSLFSNKLYNILHEFRRALIYNGSKNYPNHAK